MQAEIWKDVSGYEGYYQVSTFGNVRSLDRTLVRNRTGWASYSKRVKGMPIRPNIVKSSGRYVIRLTMGGKTFSTQIGRVVALTFIPNPENKPVVNHIDGDRTNNRVENLEWATYSENSLHAVDTGLHKFRGEDNPLAKLKNEDIPKIRKLLQDGVKPSKIAAEYGVSCGTIYYINKNVTWKTSEALSNNQIKEDT